VANQLGATISDLLPQLGTVGEVMYGVELKILSVRTKQLAARNEEGEIVIRSPSLMSAYLDSPLETSQTLDGEGWLYSGDLGFLDDHGRLSITGRLKEIIMVKG
jgi:long-subunit acyl-CoA synthetase (AMP-forming)